MTLVMRDNPQTDVTLRPTDLPCEREVRGAAAGGSGVDELITSSILVSLE